MKQKQTIYMLLTLSVVLFLGYLYNNSPFVPDTPNIKGVSTQADIETELKGTVVETVVDGDTVKLSSGETVRLIGINSPEEGQPYYADAKSALEGLVLKKEIRLETDVSQSDVYGRTLGYLFVDDALINQKMIELGFAFVSTVPPDIKYVDRLVSSAETAKSNCSGLWEGLCSPTESSCIQISKINPLGSFKNEEWIELKNTCTSTKDITGYLIKDTSASNSYTFESASMSAKALLRLYSGCGNNSRTSFYWRCPEQKNFIWNNDTDRAYLFDASGKLVSELGY